MRAARAPGFTLVELLVVLAILGLVLAALPGAFTAALPGVEAKAAARRTVAALRLTRERAIREARAEALLVRPAAHRLEPPGAAPVQLPRRLALRLETARGELVGARAGAIRFFPDGSSSGGRIVLSAEGRGYQVGVHWLTGQVRMAPWSAP
ncbi:GspH/FimT family pseudopilin [Marichromatium bheemlicum]|uniref:Type II secretion system protein H n=1 Tax=Marichromatium bheemlicum TaxID=365339 RepID=A0ABX1I5D4_9GAMM|nr:prepilin-type N-terminal cleavage/methylation domain-containing protein [Marichromatium bheemlicum]